jgi:hypothetical protein
MSFIKTVEISGDRKLEDLLGLVLKYLMSPSDRPMNATLWHEQTVSEKV